MALHHPRKSGQSEEALVSLSTLEESMRRVAGACFLAVGGSAVSMF